MIDKDDIVSLASLIEARPSDMPRSKDNETLLDFYPQLKDVDVLIAPYGSRTFYSYNEKVIQISKNVVDLGMDEFYLTIVHEVQHAVQHIEGFAVGAGLSSVESQLRSAITDAYDLRMTALAKSESIADDYQMVYEDFLADKENAEGEEIKDLPNSDSFIAYDKYKTYVEIVNSATFEYNFLEDLLKTRMQPNGKELVTDFELYMAFAGEAEARNASRRAKMSKEERRSTPLSRSEDIVRDEQIVQYPGEVTSPKVKRMAIDETFKNAAAPNFITEEDRREFQSMSLSDTQDEANDELWAFVQRRNFNEEQVEEVLESELWDEVSDSVKQNEEKREEEAYYEKNPHDKQLEEFSDKMEAYEDFDFAVERAGTGTSYVTISKLSFDKNGKRSKEDVAQIRFANHMRAYNPKNPDIANYDIGPDYNTTVDGVIKRIVGDAKPKAKRMAITDGFEDTKPKPKVLGVDTPMTQEDQKVVDFVQENEDYDTTSDLKKTKAQRIPEKTQIAYKLFRVKRNQPGKLFPLYVRANKEVPIGEWIDAVPGDFFIDKKVEKELNHRLAVRD